jgi:ABC-2 type transport system permease protein
MISAVIRAGWLNLRRDRAALMLSFIVPIVFFSIFAAVFGAQRSKTPKTTLAIADLDRTENSRRLIAALQDESALKLVEAPKDGVKFDAKSAEAYVRGGNAPVALVIPKGFGATRMHFGGQAKDTPEFRILADSADPIADQVVGGLLEKTVMTSMPSMLMDAGVEEIDRWSGGFTPQQKATLNSSMGVWKQRDTAAPHKKSSLDSLVKITRTDVVGQNKSNLVVALQAAGIGVMFLLFTATNAGGALLEENESGTLDRILTTRLTMSSLLLGKLAYLWTLGFAQLCVMFTWGALVFRLELFQHLGGFLLMAIPTTLATSAFGLLLASICRTRAQLAAISTLVVLSLSALGGSMFPRFLMPEGLQKVGLVLFNSWALEGFTSVFWRDEPLTAVILPALVLTAWAIVFFVAARQLTKRWEVA